MVDNPKVLGHLPPLFFSRHTKGPKQNGQRDSAPTVLYTFHFQEPIPRTWKCIPCGRQFSLTSHFTLLSLRDSGYCPGDGHQGNPYNHRVQVPFPNQA
jgi:hypothetical protein